MKPVSWYKSLAMPKYRRQYGFFLVEGKRAVDQLLMYHSGSVKELLCANDYDLSALPSLSLQKKIPVRKVSAANMKTICTARTPQGVAALARMPEDAYSPKTPDMPGDRILLLEHIQDPGNVGTLIRTAAAFGINGIILSDQCADPFSPKAVQSTAGSLLSVWIRKTNGYLSMTTDLKNTRGYKLIAADLNGSEPIGISGGIDRYILALGNEGQGLTGELLDKCDCRARIPIKESGAESLNVAVSGGILMFAFSTIPCTCRVPSP